jgi:hypothetical protein
MTTERLIIEQLSFRKLYAPGRTVVVAVGLGIAKVDFLDESSAVAGARF